MKIAPPKKNWGSFCACQYHLILCRGSVNRRKKNPPERANGFCSLRIYCVAPFRIDVSQMRLQGLEPWTYGLKVRCSTN